MIFPAIFVLLAFATFSEQASVPYADAVCARSYGVNPTYVPGPTCGTYYECSNGTPNLMPCPTGLHFNLAKRDCDYPYEAGCQNDVQQPPKHYGEHHVNYPGKYDKFGKFGKFGKRPLDLDVDVDQTEE